MGDYQQSIQVSAPAGPLFDYLSDVGNLPHYFTAMTSAQPAGEEAVQVVAALHGTTRTGEAWFRADHDCQHLDWGSEGPNDYHGHLDVTGDATTATVTVFLHTRQHDSNEIGQGITDTLTTIKRLAEAGPTPGPASG